jgi:hypothetical protein
LYIDRKFDTADGVLAEKSFWKSFNNCWATSISNGWMTFERPVKTKKVKIKCEPVLIMFWYFVYNIISLFCSWRNGLFYMQAINVFTENRGIEIISCEMNARKYKIAKPWIQSYYFHLDWLCKNRVRDEKTTRKSRIIACI